MSTTTASTRRRRTAVAVLAALAGIAAGAFLSQDDAAAGRLVTGRQIADGSLTGTDLRDGTVTSSDLSDGSLTAADLDALGVVDGRGAAPGPPGRQGPAGPVGPAGPEGRPGVDRVRHVTTSSGIASGAYASVTTSCPESTQALAGGFRTSGQAVVVAVSSAPLDGGTGWYSLVKNTSSTGATLHGWVVCAIAS